VGADRRRARGSCARAGYVRFLRERAPGYGDGRLGATAARIGVPDASLVPGGLDEFGVETRPEGGIYVRLTMGPSSASGSSRYGTMPGRLFTAPREQVQRLAPDNLTETSPR
jgi:hypothetical protein